MVLHLKNSFVSLKINYLMYFFKTGSFRPNQCRLDRFRSVNRFIRWTGPVTGSGFKNIALATKIGGEAKAHEISNTQKWFGQILNSLGDIKIINIFNGVPKSKLREIKILM